MFIPFLNYPTPLYPKQYQSLTVSPCTLHHSMVQVIAGRKAYYKHECRVYNYYTLSIVSYTMHYTSYILRPQWWHINDPTGRQFLVTKSLTPMQLFDFVSDLHILYKYCQIDRHGTILACSWNHWLISLAQSLQ